MSVDQDASAGTRRRGSADERRPRGRRGGIRPAGDELPTRPRSYGSVVLGVALVAACGLGGALYLSSAGDTESVIVLSGPVAEGETIERSDLVSSEVAGVDGAFSVDDLSSVEGQTAAVDLVEGQVLIGEQVTDEPLPGEGEALVGVALEAPQVPGDGLEVGDVVRVVGVGAQDSSTPGKPKVLASSAQVYRVRADDTQTDTHIISLVVDDAAADPVAAYAAAGRVSLVEISASGGS